MYIYMLIYSYMNKNLYIYLYVYIHTCGMMWRDSRNTLGNCDNDSFYHTQLTRNLLARTIKHITLGTGPGLHNPEKGRAERSDDYRGQRWVVSTMDNNRLAFDGSQSSRMFMVNRGRCQKLWLAFDSYPRLLAGDKK